MGAHLIRLSRWKVLNVASCEESFSIFFFFKKHPPLLGYKNTSNNLVLILIKIFLTCQAWYLMENERLEDLGRGFEMRCFQVFYFWVYADLDLPFKIGLWLNFFNILIFHFNRFHFLITLLDFYFFFFWIYWVYRVVLHWPYVREKIG